jgi:hypothetical protein
MTHVYGASRAAFLPGMALLDNWVLLMTSGIVSSALETFLKVLGLRRHVGPPGVEAMPVLPCAAPRARRR